MYCVVLRPEQEPTVSADTIKVYIEGVKVFLILTKIHISVLTNPL